MWFVLAIALSVFMIPGSAKAGLVCLWKADGKPFEYQSHGRPGTCKKNAIGSNIDPSLIEEREITEGEWKAIREKWIDAPARQRAGALKLKRQSAKDKLKALGLTDDELKALGIR